MSIDGNDGADSDNDGVDDDNDADNDDADDNDENAGDDDDNGGLGDEEGGETVFHRPPNPRAATVDSDTESETSDEEEEHQSVSPLDPENTGYSGPSSTQAGRCSHSVVGYPTSTEPWGTCCRQLGFHQVWW